MVIVPSWGVVGLWAALAAPIVAWAARGFGDEDGAARAVVAAIGAFGIVRRAPWRDLHPAALRAAPLGWTVVGLAIVAASPASLETARGIGVVALGYGLLGLHLPSARWRELGAAVPLAIVSMPIGPWVDAVLGWPLRTGTARVAAAALGGVPTATIIAVEGSFAHVDLPCAGLRSVWAGLAALVAVSAAAGRPLDRGWLAAAATLVVGLLAGNVVRVIGLVGVGHLLGWTLVADTLHVPLGLVSFAAAGAGAWAVWQALPPRPAREAQALGGPRAQGGLGVVGLGLLVVLGAGPARTVAVVPPPPPALPAGWVVQEGTPAERAFASQHGAAMIHGREPSVGAAVVLVSSRSWLAHHVPVRCLQAAGWTIEADRPAQLGGRWVRRADVVRDGRRATAIWWFQRGDHVTDDAVIRIGAGWGDPAPWVLVSVLLDDAAAADGVVGALMATVGETGRGA